MTLRSRLLLGHAWRTSILVLLFDFTNPVSNSLLLETEGAMTHGNASLLLTMIDFDPHIGLRAL